MAIALCGVKHAEKPICVAAEQCKAEAKRKIPPPSLRHSVAPRGKISCMCSGFLLLSRIVNGAVLIGRAATSIKTL